jgi:hypothetical protein
MNYTTLKLVTGAVFTACAGLAGAAVTPEEAKILGTTHTFWGAEKAGNKDGTIPAYSGGMTKPPTGYVAAPLGRSQLYPDPYAADKPLYRIDAKNIDKYADKLTPGTQALIKKNPGYYIDIYPTRRSASLPEALAANTIRNATKCATAAGGVSLELACRGGVPFPIPKTGNEVMWNKIVNYLDPEEHRGESWIVDPSGRKVMTGLTTTYNERPYYSKEGRADTAMYQIQLARLEAPARIAGGAAMSYEWLNAAEKGKKSYSYTPGQRRVKLSPENAYDIPSVTSGGAAFADDIYLFSGKMDRFDFKLIGKKEMLIPYNNYKLYDKSCSTDMLLKPTTLNPDCERFELHRVWVVEATLKPGQRHSYSKRVLYLDEDNMIGGAMEAYDQGGALWRSAYLYTFQAYDRDFSFGTTFVMHDFNKRIYSIASYTAGTGYKWVKPLSEVDMSPEGYAAVGAR